MQPDFAKNMGMSGQGYTNPFAATGILGMGTAARASKAANIIPPLVAELTDYNLGGELDSSSDFLDFENSYRKRRQQIDLLDERSDGELAFDGGIDDSIGEIHPSPSMKGNIAGPYNSGV